MKWILAVLALMLSAFTVHAQWTEPVPMVPQFGAGVRSVWISNDNLRLYVVGGLSTLAVTTRDSIRAPWGSLVILPHHINYTGTQNSVCESPSGETLYFTSDSDQRPGQEGYGWLDVYYCVRSDTGWGPAVNCGDSVNGPGQEWSVNISRDGSLLLLASHGTDGEYITHELWYCQKHTDGAWGRPVLFGDSLVSSSNKQSPSLSPDNTRLFFYWIHSYSMDLMESCLVNGVWRTATPLPAPVNSPISTEMNPCMANDGRTLWFRSDRSGDDQIYTSVDTTALSVSPPSRDTGGDVRLISVSSYPNPFNAATTISYSISKPGPATLRIYDIAGREVKALRSGLQESGDHQIVFDGSRLSSGIYFVRLEAGELSQTKKIVLLK